MNSDRSLLCQHYLHVLYQGMSGHGATASQEKGDIAETYGEILYPSIDTLLSILNLNEHDIFFDLGSGLGKFVLYIFLQTSVKAAYGIEILPRLHEQALQAAQKCQQELPDFYSPGRELHFLAGSFLEIPLTQASAVLVGSPCFGPRLLQQLGKILDNTQSIHSVLSLRPMCSLQRLRFKKAIRIECSWDTTLCYLYEDPLHARKNAFTEFNPRGL